MVYKSFKAAGIAMTIDEFEDKMFIGNNPLLEDDQVMVNK